MKFLTTNKHYIYILLLFIGSALLTCSSQSLSKKDRQPQVYSYTVSPTVPQKITFCGQEIDLKRFDLHERMDRELSSFTYYHSTTLLLFKRANRYFPIIEPILKEKGVPDDMKYLAVIESNLDPLAISPAGASGIWQFMKSTATHYGLDIHNTVDERYHLERATRAACDYLLKAYEIYKNWSTVAASYNAGMARISKELHQQQQEESNDLWLNKETSRYVFRIYAVKMIFENPLQYGFVIYPEQLYRNIATEEVEVTKDILNLAEFAKKHKISYSTLKAFNPWLRSRKLEVKGKKYNLKIPKLQDLNYDHPVKVHNPNWLAPEDFMKEQKSEVNE